MLKQESCLQQEVKGAKIKKRWMCWVAAAYFPWANQYTQKATHRIKLFGVSVYVKVLELLGSSG